MNTQHTPGPWYINEGVEVRGTNPIGGNRADYWICRLSANPNRKADATLIEQSPNLLAGLIYLLDRVQPKYSQTPQYIAACEAVDKATLTS